jgi:hypothetical protein
MTHDSNTGDLDTTDELIAERRVGVPGDTPDDMSKFSRMVVGNIDVMSHWVGKLTCLLLLPVIFFHGL